MADLPLPIILSKPCSDRLQLLADAYNAESRTLLTLVEWVTLHLRELAISREWSDRVQTMQREMEAAHNAAVRDERTRLLAGL